MAHILKGFFFLKPSGWRFHPPLVFPYLSDSTGFKQHPLKEMR